jgi:hypothetical protein
VSELANWKMNEPYQNVRKNTPATRIELHSALIQIIRPTRFFFTFCPVGFGTAMNLMDALCFNKPRWDQCIAVPRVHPRKPT